MSCLIVNLKEHVDFNLLVRNISNHGTAIITGCGVYVDVPEYKVGVQFEPTCKCFTLVGASEDIVNFIVKTGGIDHYCQNAKPLDNFGVLMGCGVNNYTEMCYFDDNPLWYFFEVEAQQEELKKLEAKLKVENANKYLYSLKTGRWGSLDAKSSINPEWEETPAATLLIKLHRMAQERLASLTRVTLTSFERLRKIKYVADTKKSLGYK